MKYLVILILLDFLGELSKINLKRKKIMLNGKIILMKMMKMKIKLKKKKIKIKMKIII
jgi:hypothetical protein